MHVQEQRLGLRPRDCTANTLVVTGDHSHARAGGSHDLGDRPALNITVPGRGHLAFSRQVEPKLEAFHPPLLLLGHFGMDDAATGNHPLDATVFQQAFVTSAIAMAHATIDHVGDRLETAMGVIGKASDVVVRIVAAKDVEHQEGIESALKVLGQDAHDANTCSVGYLPADDDALDRTPLLDR